MKLTNEKVCKEGLFSVGYHEETGLYVANVIVPWICWYSRYFEITKEEYELFDTDLEKLKELCKLLISVEVSDNKRFLFSERAEENETEDARSMSSLFKD